MTTMHNTVRTRERRDCRCPRARHVHGTRAAYQKDGCGCFPCRLANATSRRVTDEGGHYDDGRLTDATGTRRRLQALAAIGISGTVIAEHLEVTADNVLFFRRTTGRVSVNTAARVAAVYDLLWDQPQDDANARKAKTHARKMGWPPPMAWDDDSINDPDVTPKDVAYLPAPGQAPCGTHAAYKRHRKHGEPVDARCAAAEKSYQAERHLRRKAKRSAAA